MSNQEKPKGRSSQGTQSTPNPAKYFIQWKSKNEAFSYYNKEKEEDVKMPKPFSFIPLFIAYSVKGFSQKKGVSYISNEVEDLANDVITVKSYNAATKTNKVEWQGVYKDIKETMDENCKFTVSLYIGIKPKKGDMLLANIQMNGAALHHWIDFTKKNDIFKVGIKVESDTDEKKGAVKYKAPVYEATSISEEDDAKAGELQDSLKEYLNTYFEKNRVAFSKTNDKAQDNGLNNGKSKPESKSEKSKAEKDIVSRDIDDDDDDDSAPF